MLSASLYQGHYAGNHKLLNINGDIYTQYAGAAGMLLHTHQFEIISWKDIIFIAEREIKEPG